MKNKRNILLSVLIGIFLIGGIVTAVFRILQDEDAFNVVEKNYLVANKSNLITINVLNDANVFGKDGKGVFYDFLESFEKENNVAFNKVTTSVNNTSSGLSLAKDKFVPKDAKLVYTDHYVLVGKKHANISSMNGLKDTIGYVVSDSDIINSNLISYSLALKSYDDRNALLEGFKNDEVAYIIVPRLEYLDSILDGLYSIVYHYSDIKDYYFIMSSQDETLTSILNKYYNKWSVDNLQESFDKNEYEIFTTNLKITEKELDVINRKKYMYGFIENAPYDVKRGGEYGGIVGKYIQDFSRFSGISFDYKKYKDYGKLSKAISKKDVDIFVNLYGMSSNMESLETTYMLDISIVQANKDSRLYTSLKGMQDEAVYVKDNSLVQSYLKSLGINVMTYKTDKELNKIIDKNGIIAMDYANYLVFKESNPDVNERFRINTTTPIVFQSNNDTMFNRLFSYYMSTLDKNEVIYAGIEDYNKTVASGSLIYNITKYAVLLLIIIGVIVYVVYKLSKKVLVKKRIKRGDKIKYIDILTSLKNRNYLNDNISVWNKNTIYPQAVVVIDLNGVQEINDSFGYLEGDKQIQAVANALIKTQLDNSEIMRTDGNEFTVYMVGYNEKQLISYVKKLSKEFKNLPHDKDAAIGFSMIEDDVKLVGDAINEATEKMKENKALYTEEVEDEKI